MNVLSLFDGMSCGRIALERLGIQVDNYYASEIDKYAMKVSEANYPDIIQVGDVTELDTSTLPNIDLIMGGSPCQGFSFAGKQLAFDDPRSALFFEFVRCVKELKPKYFLLENVRMKKEYLDIISEHMGVEPIMINSALVSAQNRVRYYWTNIPGVEQPEQRGIVLRDILETNTSSEYLAGENLQKNYKGGNQLNPNYKSQANTIHDVDGKSGTICAGTHGYANGYVEDFDKNLSKMTTKENKSYALTASYPAARPRRSKAKYEKTMVKVDDINNLPNNVDYVYDQNDKSHKPKTAGSSNMLVEDKEVYWRKLTPIECERLQTVPDDYTNHVSNTQRYKMLGNGWTVDVIAHILQNMEINHREC